MINLNSVLCYQIHLAISQLPEQQREPRPVQSLIQQSMGTSIIYIIILIWFTSCAITHNQYYHVSRETTETRTKKEIKRMGLFNKLTRMGLFNKLTPLSLFAQNIKFSSCSQYGEWNFVPSRLRHLSLLCSAEHSRIHAKEL